MGGRARVHLSFGSSAWFDRSPRRYPYERRTPLSTPNAASRGARPSDQQITLNTNNHITLSADLYTTLFKRPPLL